MNETLNDNPSLVPSSGTDEPLRMSLVSAFHYLCDIEQFPEGEIIDLECFRDEGRKLQAYLLREYAGMTRLSEDWMSDEMRAEWRAAQEAKGEATNELFAALVNKVHEKGAAVQFLDTYPTTDSDGENLHVLILARETAQDALSRAAGTLGMALLRKPQGAAGGVEMAGGGAPGPEMPMHGAAQGLPHEEANQIKPLTLAQMFP